MFKRSHQSGSYNTILVNPDFVHALQHEACRQCGHERGVWVSSNPGEVRLSYLLSAQALSYSLKDLKWSLLFGEHESALFQLMFFFKSSRRAAGGTVILYYGTDLQRGLSRIM